MKQTMFSKVLSAVACVLMLCIWAPTLAVADQAQYIYDDLGRLSKVIDGQGNVATYNYDAVGNLLSITRSTGGVGAPTVTGITPNSGAAGATVNISLAGTNLTGASLATNNSGILVRNVLTTPTSITATFQITFSAPPGAATVTVATTTGSATTSFTGEGKGDSNCLDCQARRGAPAYSEARMPQLTDQRSRPPNSVSHPCDAGSMAHATVRACSECRRDDPRCPTVFEDLGYVGLSRLGCLKTHRERTPT